MRTYSGSDSGSQIEPLFAKARESIWISSPWLGTNYAKQLASLSQKGIEVRIITSNVDYNVESLQILKASENSNLMYLVLNRERSEDRTNFIHSKIYIVDKRNAIAGSANLTYSGLHSNVENLSIAETKEEVQQIENDFMRIWMTFERKSMSKEELSSGTSYSIRNALPLLQNFGNSNTHNTKSNELVYYPYYFFEFSFRASAGKSPPVLFEKHGIVVLDGVTRQVVKDDLLYQEISKYPTEDYVLKIGDRYRLAIRTPIIRDFREAKELVLNHIIEENTQHYRQYYRSGSYDRIFVPYRNIIRFITSGFAHVPIWYVEMPEPDGSRHQDIIFGSSGRKWNEIAYCADCQKKIWINEAIRCEICGKKVCSSCIKRTGRIFRKKLCTSCSYQNK